VVDGVLLELDTDTGAIHVGGTPLEIRAPGTGVIGGIGFVVIDDMGVFTAASFRVTIGATWTATGRNALALFAAGEIAIDGVLDGGGRDASGGPAGGPGGTGGLPIGCGGADGGWKMSIGAGAGGGGGGGRTAGGRGADTAADGMGATAGGGGGAICATPSTIPLRGGHGGGAGGSELGMVMGGPGGGGGGAIALIAMDRVRIGATGRVAVPGAGGLTGPGGSGGGGGGSGGGVLVESPDVIVDGAITANGGGGGAAQNPTPDPIRGERGHLGDAIPAQGALFGGNGGAGSGAPTSGATSTGGGGGGGATGAIEIRRVIADLVDAVISPPPALSDAVVE
jgi:hypothetical protein